MQTCVHSLPLSTLSKRSGNRSTDVISHAFVQSSFIMRRVITPPFKPRAYTKDRKGTNRRNKKDVVEVQVHVGEVHFTEHLMEFLPVSTWYEAQCEQDACLKVHGHDLRKQQCQ